MAEKKLKVGRQYRDFVVRQSDVNVDRRTVSLSFSSEMPVERWFGMEILDHSPGACDLSRLKRSGALLIDHDSRNQVGVIEEATIGDDRMGRANVRFGRSTKAEEIFQDVIDEIRKNSSVGYEVLELKLEKQQENGPDIYRATKWMPFEISLVSIPADTQVGVGRDDKGEERELTVILPDPEKLEAEPKVESTRTEARNMNKNCDVCGGDLVEGKCTGPKHNEMEDALRRVKNVSAEDMEKNRKRAIDNLCKANKLGDNYREMWIAQGVSLEQVSDDILKILEERGKNNPQPLTRIGLSSSETQRFSMIRAIQALVDKDWKNAGYELEVSRAVAQKLGRVNEPEKFLVPYEVLERSNRGANGGSYRDLSAGTTNVGGYLVETQNVGFVELLRNRSVCMRMGATRLPGLQGNVAIPKQTAGATAYWLTNEATSPTEGGLVFAQISLSPKNVAAYVEISRQLLMQSSPGAEGIVNNDLALQVATAADAAGLEGSGAPQPTGIASTASIGAFTGATLGIAAILDAQADVAGNNVIPLNGGYVTTPQVAALLMQRQWFTSTDTPIWRGNIFNGQVAGYPAMSSNQLTAATAIYGAWEDLVMAEWGVLEVSVNPFANFPAGIVGVRAMYSMDIGVRRAGSFSRATGIT